MRGTVVMGGTVLMGDRDGGDRGGEGNEKREGGMVNMGGKYLRDGSEKGMGAKE